MSLGGCAALAQLGYAGLRAVSKADATGVGPAPLNAGPRRTGHIERRVEAMMPDPSDETPPADDSPVEAPSPPVDAPSDQPEFPPPGPENVVTEAEQGPGSAERPPPGPTFYVSGDSDSADRDPL